VQGWSDSRGEGSASDEPHGGGDSERSECSEPTSKRGEGSASDEPHGGGDSERSECSEPTSKHDPFAGAQSVANATVYEGYVLYPYRASSAKNKMRFQWGVVVPRAYAEVDASERTRLRTEIVVDPGSEPLLHVRIRFLQLTQRLRDGGSWDEGVDRQVDVAAVPLLPLARAGRAVPFHFDGGEDVDEGVVRRREPLDGLVSIDVEWAAGPGALIKVAVTVENTSDWEVADPTRDEAMRRSLVGAHTLLAVDDGELISLLDPPDHALEATKGCTNVGTYPVLVGDATHPDVFLSSPIILYDHPVIAPESEGDLFDALEIDEILALRIMTLTDEEKAEARATDARAAAIVNRIDDFQPEVWERMHGTMRAIERTAVEDTEPLPWWEPAVDETYDPFTDTLIIAGNEVRKGTRVRLQPNRRADAHDMFLAGMDAVVTGVFTDVDDTVLVAVTIGDDPDDPDLAWQRRSFFFHPDELEVLF
jgi:hypothetical protein